VPCWKLFGPLARRWVPVAAWFVSSSPEVMAAAAVRYAAAGAPDAGPVTNERPRAVPRAVSAAASQCV
jgi:hypothetical protein